MALGMPVGEMLHRLSSRELSEWMAYAGLEPFGEERGDLRAGIVASTIANVNRDSKKRAKPFEAQDFMPKFAEKRQTDGMSLESGRFWLETLTAAFGGKDLRNGFNR